MLYAVLKKLLFQLNPEAAHGLTLNSLKCLQKIGMLSFYSKPLLPCHVMGLHFPNPIGLAAGLDKNGEYIDALAALGFGFIEIGTITRFPQPGHPKPRLFRLEKEQALINRFGFNSKGIDYVIQQLKKTQYKGILGINIGKNKETPLEFALEDYVYLFRHVAPYASYITINISSPNTENLRQLQHGEILQHLLQTLKQEQSAQPRYVPLVVKISPDLTREELRGMAEILLDTTIDAVIATNTTVARNGISNPLGEETGGLSGAPLRSKALSLLRELHAIFNNRIPIIASGGLMSAESAQERWANGAALIQLYTGLIYRGPGLIAESLPGS